VYRFNHSSASNTSPEQKPEVLTRSTTTGGISWKKALAIGAVPLLLLFGAAFQSSNSVPGQLQAILAKLSGLQTQVASLANVSAESQQEPFYANDDVDFIANASFMLLGTVHAGKRLVIEHVSGRCRVLVGERVTELTLIVKTVLGEQHHRLIPSFTGPTNSTTDSYDWSQSVRFIVDAGAEVKLVVLKDRPVTSGGCDGSIAGYLVDKP
jgi:hypothetical protein